MKHIFALILICLLTFPAFGGWDLKVSTAISVPVGPFQDIVDATVEEALTVGSFDADLYKNNATIVSITITASGGSNDMVFTDQGHYSLELTATDTNTVGGFRLTMSIAGVLVFWEDYNVMSTNAYDAKYGTDTLQVHVIEYDAGVLTAAAIATDAIGAAEIAAGAITSSEAPNLDLPVSSVAMLAESNRASHVWQGNVFYVDPVNGATHASGARGGRLDPYLGVQDCHDNAITDRNHDVILLIAGHGSTVTTLDEQVTLTKSYFFIRGPGRNFDWKYTSNGDVITVTGDGVELSGFQIETHTTGNGDAIQITDADFTRVSHLWINTTRGWGVNILRGSSSQIFDNTFHLTGQDGISGCINIKGTAGASNFIRIKRNHLENTTGDGIVIADGTTEDTVIIGNWFQEITGTAINIGASGLDTLVIGNVLGNNGTDITDAGTTSVIANNTAWARLDISTETRLAELDAANLPSDVDDILADTAVIGALGAGLTNIPWNASWDVEVESEVNDALVAIHLDHAFAVDYDPASPPGVGTALWNELIESNAGVSRFTAAALAQGPSGGGGATLGNQTTILARLGSWTATGDNTVLGGIQALASKDAATPSDIGGTFTAANDSNEAIRDQGDTEWGGRGVGLVTITDATLDDLGVDMVYSYLGAGVGAATVKAYVKTEHIANPNTAVLRGQTVTLVDGTWQDGLLLNATVTYRIVFFKEGQFGPDTQDVTP